MKSFLNYLTIFFLSLALTSCEIIGDIFKGGMWTGAILVILVIGGVIWLFSRVFGGRRR
ncbi:hypothetical protein GCM10027275_54090 [Rhabdobacter roseus]|uniref:Heme/copper-type cytochrome/quinol oxidase subunit 4 n=1 Tax=Rhabdobacter roseus TaxID=1655419 RepID=A0A840TW04_9BACT|nr:hypothetical protein [Rhabdobacter roseus]MBB5287424.1 heme/copper-type cytochrome/quinol oxidase subunit 4 [Rhabdobacter roseus]